MEPLPPSERLAAVMAAASAPPEPRELAGEEAALAAFRGRPARRRFSLKRAIGVKLTVALAMTLAAGGVAVANILPSPFHANVMVEQTRSPSRPARPQPEPPPKRSEVTPTPRPRAAGAADHLVLCRKFADTAWAERAKALQTPEFTPLATAAGGGVKAVWGYCLRLGAYHPSMRPWPWPWHDRPGGR